MRRHTADLIKEGCSSDDGTKVCRSRGGESCAFDGAMVVLQPIADAAHIVHGPIACLGNSWEGRGSHSDKGRLLLMGFTSDMDELDIVYGAEKKLFDTIERVIGTVSPKAVFIHSTCVSGMIGEDMEAVARRASATFGLPVIPVSAPGFAGPKNLGNRVAGQVLLDHVIGTGEPDFELTGNEINLVGEYNIAGDLGLVEPVLKRAGIRILSRMTGNASYEEITYAHRARLNVLLCGRALVNVATGMRERYGTPYIEASFLGMSETSLALRGIAHGLGSAEITDAVEHVIAQEEGRVRDALGPYAHFNGRKVVLYSGGVKSWAMIAALRDLGLEIVAVGTKKSSAHDEEKMRALLGPSAPLIEDVAPKNLLKLMRERGAELMVAGGRNLYLGIKEGFPFIDVNQERHTAYAGYDGLLNLAHDIDEAMRFYGVVPKRDIQLQSCVTDDRAGSINPLKHSSAMGAALAIQGVDGAIAVLHGAQGCNFLGKVLLTKHFREPIALQSTKLFVEDVVLGSETWLGDTVAEIVKKQSPALIGVLSTALSEVKGDDIAASLMELRLTNGPAELVYVPTPDYEGGMETGYVQAVQRLVDCMHECETSATRINVLAGLQMSPADVLYIKRALRRYGLSAHVLPDISCLDGSRQGFSGLAKGGIKMDDLRLMGSAAFTIAVGLGMEAPAKAIKERFKIEYAVLPGMTGLRDSDAFFEVLRTLSGRAMHEDDLRARNVLMDTMRDAQAFFGGRRVCLALEPSHTVQYTRWMAEMGADVRLAVIPQRPGFSIHARSVVVGDLDSVRGKFDLMVSNSHAVDTARAMRVPVYQDGFPLFKVFGRTLQESVGYQGTVRIVSDIATLLMEAHT